MRTFGLIGYPLGHSFSQKYFQEKFHREQIPDVSYRNFPLEDISRLPGLLSAEPQLAGLNVTIPYKEQVIGYLNGRDEVVEKTGACNCIRITRGLLFGYNTDVTGFERSLLSLWEPRHNRALVLGTGGAAKAVGYVLDKLGIPFISVTRRTEPGSGQLTWEALDETVVSSHPLIINTTPLGMYPHSEQCPPIPYQGIGAGHFLYDLVYNPAMTLFLSQGARRGAVTLNGYDMLVIQAEESWRIWNS